MIKPGTALLAAVLTTPFGLAIHDELTIEAPALVHLDRDWNTAAASLTDDNLGALDEPLAGEQAPQLSENSMRQLFGEQRATMGPALGALRFGATREQARQAMPERWELRQDELSAIVVKPVYLAKANTLLTAVRVEMDDPERKLPAFLRARWGEPELRSSAPELVWVNANSGLRAALFREHGSSVVVFTRSVAPGQLFAVSSTNNRNHQRIFAFESKPLLGMSTDELMQIYADAALDPHYGEYAKIELPVLSTDPTDAQSTALYAVISGSKVGELHFTVACGQGCTELQAALAAKYGPARPGLKPGIRTYGSSPAVTAQVMEGQPGVLTVRFSQ